MSPCPPWCPPRRQVGKAGSAAVCAYSSEDLEKVFEGKYKELNKESSRWTVYGGPDVSPRPGSVSAAHSPPHPRGGWHLPQCPRGRVCPFAPARGISLGGASKPSSPCLSFPRGGFSLPAVLHGSFLRQSPHLHEGPFPDGREGGPHPGEAAAGEGRRRLHAHRGGRDPRRLGCHLPRHVPWHGWVCVGRGPPHGQPPSSSSRLPPPNRSTHGCCPPVPAAADGFLHKAVEMPAGPHIVESVQLFPTPEPVKNLLLSPGKVRDGEDPKTHPVPRWHGLAGEGSVPQLSLPRASSTWATRVASCKSRWPTAACTGAAPSACWHGTRTAPGTAPEGPAKPCVAPTRTREPGKGWWEWGDGGCQEVMPAASPGLRGTWLQDVEEGSPGRVCHRGRSVAMPRARGAPEDPAVES